MFDLACDGPGRCHICDGIDPDKVFHTCPRCGAEVTYYSFFNNIADPTVCEESDEKAAEVRSEMSESQPRT